MALAGLLIDPLKAVAVHDNVYVNKKLGILFHKPRDWGFISVTDFGKLKDAQVFGEGLDMTKDEIWQDLGTPICVATKYPDYEKPELYGIFSPTITLHITPKKDLEYLGYRTFEELIDATAQGTSLLLKDFKVVRSYEPYLISGVKFYEHDAEYMFEHEEMNAPLKAELKTLRAEHNGFYYDFNCHQSLAQGQVAEKEFEEFRKSIRLI